MKFCLLDMSGNTQYELNQGKNFVGRDSSCEIHIDDKLLSRRHAVIGVALEQVAIRDLNSTNGTLVNYKKVVDARSLQIGDAVSFGEVTLRLAYEGVPLQQTMLGRIPDDGESFSVSDPGGDVTALRQNFPLPPGFQKSFLATETPRQLDADAILQRSSVDLSGAVGALVGGFDNQQDAVFSLSEGQPYWDLGRGDDSHLLLADDTISQRHARIWRDERGWSIEDMASKNGTKINGKKVKQSVLNSGDQIELGYLRYIFIDLVKSPAEA